MSTQPEPGHYRHTITDPHAHSLSRVMIAGRLDQDVYNYFFRAVLPAAKGPRQAMISQFFQKLYEACIEAKIAPVWDEENEGKVNEILMRLNFNPQRTAADRKVKTK